MRCKKNSAPRQDFHYLFPLFQMFIAGVLAIWVGKKGEGIERLPIEETPCSVKGLVSSIPPFLITRLLIASN